MSNTQNIHRLSALHHRHLQLGAKLLESEGWLIAASYGDGREAETATRAAGVCDISHNGKIDVKGGGIDTFLGAALAGLAPRKPGEVRINTTGGPGLSSPVRYVCRLSRQHALAITHPFPSARPALGVPADLIKDSSGGYLTNVTSVLAGIGLVGPSSEAIMNKLTQVWLAPPAPGGAVCAECGLAKVHSLIVRKTVSSNGGNLASFDIYFGRDYAEYIWDAILEAGREFHATPIGLEAYSSVHGEPGPKARKAGGAE